MSRGQVSVAEAICSWIVLLGMFAFPILGLGYGLLTDSTGETTVNSISGRSLELFLRTAALSAIAAITSVIVAIPAACATARLGRDVFRSFIGLSMLATILSPPMVYAFAWQRTIPVSVPPQVRCVITWALWAWPIPAWFLGTAIGRISRQTREAALLDTSGLALLSKVTIPQLVPAIATCLLLLFTLFLGDYGVPHACGLQVYATELLSRAESSNTPTAVIVASLPCVALILILLIALSRTWAATATTQDAEPSYRPKASPIAPKLVGLVYFLMCWFVPLAILVLRISWSDMVQSWIVYGGDLAATILVSLAAGSASVLIGLLIIRQRKTSHVALLFAIIGGALPGALIGEGLVAAYNRPILGYVYDRWPIISLSYLLHFGWIGIATVHLATRLLPAHIVDQSGIDGASRLQHLTRVFIPNTWPMLAVGVGVITVLSIADIATSTLVRVPAFNPIAHVIIEKFHRLEDGMMIALSLNIVGVALLFSLMASRFIAPRWHD